MTPIITQLCAPRRDKSINVSAPDIYDSKFEISIGENRFRAGTINGGQVRNFFLRDIFVGRCDLDFLLLGQ